MLSIEEIKLLIEKLEKIKGHNFQKLIDDNLKILKDLSFIVDINNLKQEYCSIEHTINFCHKDPAIGTKLNNVYIGHCVCNREQGGYSEIERVKQIIRLCKNNDNYKKLFLSEIN